MDLIKELKHIPNEILNLVNTNAKLIFYKNQDHALLKTNHFVVDWLK